MARWAGRRSERRPRARPLDLRFILGIILVVALVGFYAYKHWNAPPQPAIVGTAWVIDGDTIDVSGTRIRLQGIDAPESDQACTDSKGAAWPCGRAAARELMARIRGRELICDRRGLDRFQRVLAVCFLPDGADVNAWMVRQGWALSSGFVKIYGSEEAEAEAAKRGIWAGSFMHPRQWRESHPR
jgi:endonuclease YncB( thermonuclease family)